MPTLSRRTAPWLVAAALLIPLAGCGGSSTPDSAPAADSGSGSGSGGGKAGDCTMLVGPTVCFHYDITGTLTTKGVAPGTVGTGNGVDYESCADWTKGEPGGDDDQPALYLPNGGPTRPGDTFGGLTGDIIEHYKGPGTYTGDDLSGQGSPSGIITPSVQDNYVLGGDDATGSMTINADGSGSFTFTNLSTHQADGKKVSGSVTWTCSNP